MRLSWAFSSALNHFNVPKNRKPEYDEGSQYKSVLKDVLPRDKGVFVKKLLVNAGKCTFMRKGFSTIGFHTAAKVKIKKFCRDFS